VRRYAVTAVGAIVICLAISGGTPAARSQAARDVTAYEGLGTWISIFGTKAYTDPNAVAAAIAAKGVKTVYVETGNSSQTVDVVRQDRLGMLVDALHASGVRVVAWYLPTLVHPAIDLRRALAAVRFTTPSGGTFDGFALDIESAAVKRAAIRTRRVLALSQRLRTAVGPDYTLGAIIPSARGMEIVPTYWPGFPFSELARLYDVFLPMDYWSFSVSGVDATYGYLARSLAILRSQLGNADFPVHLVGGTTGNTRARDDAAFAQVVADDGHVMGWSLFDYFRTKSAEWRVLRTIGATP
jgi:hypothetical protein